MGKKIKRDERGHAILIGSVTFGQLINPKISKQSRAHRLKSEASDRLLLLLKGKCRDRFSDTYYVNNHQKRLLESHNELASQPPIVQFAFYRSKLNSLREELKELNNCNNYRKLLFKGPAITMEIKETEKRIRELGDIIMSEKR